jgi:hypothetical protein
MHSNCAALGDGNVRDEVTGSGIEQSMWATKVWC